MPEAEPRKTKAAPRPRPYIQSADNDVCEAVAVDVTRRRHARIPVVDIQNGQIESDAWASAGLEPTMPDADPRKTSAAPSGSLSTGVWIAMCSDDNVGESVAVDIARSRYESAQRRASLSLTRSWRGRQLGSIRRCRRQSRGRQGCAFAFLAVVEYSGAPTIISANPSPLTSPAVDTLVPKFHCKEGDWSDSISGVGVGRARSDDALRPSRERQRPRPRRARRCRSRSARRR